MKLVNVRIKYGGQVMVYDCTELKPSLGDWVVVKNNDLVYLGQVVTSPLICDTERQPRLLAQEACDDSEFDPNENSEFGEECPVADFEMDKQSSCNKRWKFCPQSLNGRKMLRVATDADMMKQAENEVREKEAFEYCLSRVQAQKLAMKLVAVEVLFDCSKTIFYYTADDRVDFRLLVKELVSRFRTRIEMRQIGVRHEARMVGGLGQCGRGFCCCGFLANFAPVSVKMAKEQNITLSPAKISGVCGRLMCCLAFEHLGSSFEEYSADDEEI